MTKLFCADKIHLMKYINRAAVQIPDEEDISKIELWYIQHSQKPKAKERFEEYASRMSKLRCYKRNYRRDGIISLVRYSREQKLLQVAGMGSIPVKEILLRYGQSIMIRQKAILNVCRFTFRV